MKNNETVYDTILSDEEERIGIEKYMQSAAFKIWRDPISLQPEQREKIVQLPWESIGQPISKIDYQKAKETLDSEHYGMEKTKQKILQLLAVRERIGKCGRGILLVGPAGTGKTTIASIVARVLNEPFYKLPCQGITSQWELLGSNSTWKSASQGYIVDAIQRAGSFSAVICLDEIDKMEKNERQPQMALLSLFDSTNTAFIDQFLSIPLDLSGITFILTANDITKVNPILLDRLDVVHIDGYTNQEKQVILQKYIIPGFYRKYNVDKKEITFRTAAIKLIAQSCNEAGVRDAQRLADNIFRKAIYMLALGAKSIPVTEAFVRTELSDSTKPPEKKSEIGFRM